MRKIAVGDRATYAVKGLLLIAIGDGLVARSTERSAQSIMGARAGPITPRRDSRCGACRGGSCGRGRYRSRRLLLSRRSSRRSGVMTGSEFRRHVAGRRRTTRSAPARLERSLVRPGASVEPATERQSPPQRRRPPTVPTCCTCEFRRSHIATLASGTLADAVLDSRCPDRAAGFGARRTSPCCRFGQSTSSSGSRSR